jgi:hypothetical protein
MLFRAAFWIAVVAVFMPREPDLGFGRPDATGLPLPKLAGWTPVIAPGKICEGREAVCTGGLSLAADFRGALLSNLERVKADLRQSAQARREAGHNDEIGGLLARLHPP